MKRFKKPLLVNGGIIAGILFCFTAIGSITNITDVAFASGTVMLLLAPVNLIVGMVRNRNKKPDGRAYLLLAGLLLLIGFSVCSLGLQGVSFH